MNLADVKTAQQIEQYIEGCVNDLEAGVITNTETVIEIAELVGHVSKLVASKYLKGYKLHIQAHRLMEGKRFDDMLNDYLNKVRLADKEPAKSK